MSFTLSIAMCLLLIFEIYIEKLSILWPPIIGCPNTSEWMILQIIMQIKTCIKECDDYYNNVYMIYMLYIYIHYIIHMHHIYKHIYVNTHTHNFVSLSILCVSVKLTKCCILEVLWCSFEHMLHSWHKVEEKIYFIFCYVIFSKALFWVVDKTLEECMKNIFLKSPFNKLYFLKNKFIVSVLKVFLGVWRSHFEMYGHKDWAEV